MVQCKLCDREVEKLVESHIIPKSFYGSALKDPDGPARILSSNPGTRPTRSRVGEYDQNLLCEQCEASFSSYDDYAHTILFQTAPSATTFYNGEALVARFYAIDTKKLLTFFVTLLWRMHATNRPMFGSVRLGKYGERFKQASYLGDPTLVPQMDVILAKYDDTNTPILGPIRRKFDSVNGYHVSFAGSVCWLKVDSQDMPDYFAEVALSRKGPLHMLMRDFASSPERVALTKLALRHQR